MLVVLAGWGVTIYSAIKIFGGKKEEPVVVVEEVKA